MYNNILSFHIPYNEYELAPAKAPCGYKEISVYMVFDVNIYDRFNRKAWLVNGVHNFDVPSSLTYAYVVSEGSIQIAIILAELNCCDILCTIVHHS